MDAELEPLAYEDEKREFVAVNTEEDDVSEERDGIKKEASTTQVDRTTAELVNSIKKNMLLYVSRDSSPVCIYRVPAKLGRLNEEAFTPRLISIGPIHHGRPELQPMQRHKWRFFSKYLTMMSISLDQLAMVARDMENQVRQSYQESFDNFSSNDFSEMIMLDAIFLIMLLLNDPIIKQDNSLGILNEKIPNTLMVQVSPTALLPSTSGQVSRNEWVKSDIINDLMLLENQLPFFFLEHFCYYIGKRKSDLQESILRFFSRVGNMGTFEMKGIKAMHLVDILRTYYEPKLERNWRGEIVYNWCATVLREAGVKFEGVQCDYIFEMNFSVGCLKIPTLIIDKHTGILFQNLIAFEHCLGIKKDITSYIIFMDSLINTAEDVDLLVKCGVIENCYGDHESVASLLNNLRGKIVCHENEFYFEKLCIELKDYRRDRWHLFKAQKLRYGKFLRRYYFFQIDIDPWYTLSVSTAVFLLLLTLIQAVCSVISVQQSK